MKNQETIKEAAERWVGGFNAIPQGVIEKLMKLDFDEVTEITPPSLYDRVSIFGDEWAGQDGEIIETHYDGEDDLYMVRLDESGDEVVVSSYDFDVERDSFLPMWSTMWSFGDVVDEEWLTGEHLGPHLQEMADCGFRIYEQEDYGVFFGIDGAGYSFMDEHWIPLYKARGLKWHTEDENGESN